MNSALRNLIRIVIVCLPILLLSCGSVYYNTFFNAKKSFNQAEDKRKQSKRGQIDTGAYRTAIEKSLKVVENHPNSKYYDDALFVLGVSYYHLKVYPKAERRFREILANYEESEFVKESTVYLAKSKLALGDVEDAMALFEEIFSSDYDPDYKSEAAEALGMFYYEDDMYDRAEEYFMAVRDSLGTKERQKAAQMHIADGRFNSFQFGEALSSYLQILGMDPDTDEEYRALTQAATCSYRLQRIDAGMDYLQQLIDDEMYYDSIGVLKLAVAEGYEYDEEIELAVDTYLDVAQTAEQKTVKANAYYRLGLIYQYDLDDLLEAKRYYDLTLESFRAGESGKDALQRSTDIGKIAEFRDRLVMDSTTTQEDIDDAAYHQYLLAELYWFKLHKPDSAIIEMRYIVDSLPHSYDAPNAMIALSEMYREELKDTVGADSILQDLLVKYPHSDYLPTAMEQLGLAGTDADTGYAEVYIRRAEDFVLDEGNSDSAKYYYQYIVDNYPDSKYYLQARFNLLWLQEEYYNPGDSTVYYAYKDFADSFPQTEMGSLAKEKIAAKAAYTPRRSGRGEEDEEDPQDRERDRRRGIGRDDDRRDGGSQEDSGSGFGGYGDRLQALYQRPNGDTLILLDLDPIQTIEEFEFPSEAFSLDENEILLYFHVLLDFSGEVVNYELKTPYRIEEINERAKRTVGSMTFDPVDVATLVSISDLRESEDNLGYWFVYKYLIEKPDYLR